MQVEQSISWVLVVMAVINFVTWKEYPADYTVLTYYWGSLYAPLFIFYRAASWKNEAGFVVNRKVGLFILLSAVLLGYFIITGSVTTGWHSALTEAFARTGEVYFRGFVYALVLKLCLLFYENQVVSGFSFRSC